MAYFCENRSQEMRRFLQEDFAESLEQTLKDDKNLEVGKTYFEVDFGKLQG